MKVTFVTTILNEEENIGELLNSLRSQSKKLDEIIIVDGGSKDQTIKVVKNWKAKVKSEDFRKKIKLLVKRGNRSIGRNEGIKKAKSDIIVISDAGCILDRNWVKNMVAPFKSEKVKAVGGFYKGIYFSIFQKALIPYVLVMPDKANPKNFLPSARSMAVRKTVWENLGGFPENYSHNEDYFFARKLKKENVKFVFRKNAVAYYLPRKNILEAFLMFFKFAYGDSESDIFRGKAILVLTRYIIGFWILVFSLYINLFFAIRLLFYILLLYSFWAIWKNYKYVKNWRALFLLPMFQITSDFAIIFGTILGFSKGLWDTQERH